jgi:hypothetical protein
VACSCSSDRGRPDLLWQLGCHDPCFFPVVDGLTWGPEAMVTEEEN